MMSEKRRQPDGFTEHERERWQEKIAYLTDEMPSDLPIYVRRVRMANNFGDTERLKTRYVIRISKALDYSTALYFLAHEWAHALEWRDNDHGPAWSLAHAEVFKAIDREAEDG